MIDTPDGQHIRKEVHRGPGGETVRMTVSWYKNYYQGAEDQSMYEFTVEQI